MAKGAGCMPSNKSNSGILRETEFATVKKIKAYDQGLEGETGCRGLHLNGSSLVFVAGNIKIKFSNN